MGRQQQRMSRGTRGPEIDQAVNGHRIREELGNIVPEIATADGGDVFEPARWRAILAVKGDFSKTPLDELRQLWRQLSLPPAHFGRFYFVLEGE